jgi:hypothetical protein
LFFRELIVKIIPFIVVPLFILVILIGKNMLTSLPTESYGSNPQDLTLFLRKNTKSPKTYGLSSLGMYGIRKGCAG